MKDIKERVYLKVKRVIEDDLFFSTRREERQDYRHRIDIQRGWFDGFLRKKFKYRLRAGIYRDKVRWLLARSGYTKDVPNLAAKLLMLKRRHTGFFALWAIK